MRFHHHSHDQASRERDAAAAEAEERQQRWDRYFLRMARMASEPSKDPSTKVGAVIVRPDRTIASLGYNGFPRGMNDDPALYADREVKYKRVVHAEPNAILNAHGSVAGCTIYLTLFPCSSCALLIIQAGIKRVVSHLPKPGEDMSRWQASFDQTRALFAEAKMDCLLYPVPE